VTIAQSDTLSGVSPSRARRGGSVIAASCAPRVPATTPGRTLRPVVAGPCRPCTRYVSACSRWALVSVEKASEVARGPAPYRPSASAWTPSVVAASTETSAAMPSSVGRDSMGAAGRP
jgi:hypothetical protein